MMPRPESTRVDEVERTQTEHAYIESSLEAEFADFKSDEEPETPAFQHEVIANQEEGRAIWMAENFNRVRDGARHQFGLDEELNKKKARVD